MTTKTKRLAVILGPTGSGKTDLSICLARAFHSEIISSDSRQFYREIPVGTAAPTPQQLAAVPHHLIGNHSVTTPYSAGDYERDALQCLDARFAEHDLLFLVGGSGMYIDAVCNGIDDLPQIDAQVRHILNDALRSEGIDALTERLRELDPEYYAQVDRANPQRVIRALEICLTTGQPYSTLRTGNIKKRPFKILKIGVTLPREELYDRINRRVEAMMDQGLLAEAHSVFPLRSCNALNTVGFKELFDYFDGKTSLDEAIELIKRNSRRYAKRQLTWFRRDPSIHWFTPDETEKIKNFIEKFGD